MRFGYENPDEPYLFWFGYYAFGLHDEGLVIINRLRVVVFESRLPNNGYKRPWWRKS